MRTSSSSCNQRSRSGQALVEFAIALPILMLLVGGTVMVGRGYSFAVATSNAARDGARYVAGKTTTTNGPGLTEMCNVIKADLAGVTSSFSCPTQVGHAPPFVAGTDYTKPTYVYYGFNDLNLFGGLITISGSARATSSW
ncbi:MAG: pilus assembly protein [Chloroflexi bacterium]|nr:MAG: pilus assembly protein [Chloroflexota bacterium]